MARGILKMTRGAPSERRGERGEGEAEEGKGEIKGKYLFDDPKYMTAAWVQEHLSKAQV